MVWQGKSLRNSAGGRLIRAAGKRKYEMGREPALTQLGELRKKNVSGFGGKSKIKILRASYINVKDSNAGTTVRTKIETVESNPANRNYVRRNIITKGAVVQTEIGKAKVTNRPGQDGVINGVLIYEARGDHSEG
jgi:small subunit ribosomal protein S8e